LGLSTAGAITGTPTTAATSTFTVQVTDSENPTQETSANFTITINAAQACTGTNNTLLSGNYALMVNGWKNGSTRATSAVGSFVADGAGNITGGNLDIADQGKSAPQNTTFTGTYCVGSNNLATVTMNLAGGNSGTFEAALDSVSNNVSTNGHIVSYDSSGTLVSGLLRQQTTSDFSTGSIKGNYAFGMVGADTSANRFAVAGEFNSNGDGIISGENDVDDNGSLSTDQSFSASDFTVASSGAQAGRGTLTTTSNGNTMNMVVYVVSASELLMMAIDIETPTPMIMAGQVLQQSANPADSWLSGVSVMALQDLDTGNQPATSETQAGFITVSTNGQFSAAIDDNDGGTINSSTITGYYNVDSNGRMTLSNVQGCQGTCNNNPVFYLVGQNQGFLVGTDSSVGFGRIYPQTGSTFTNTSLSGLFLGGSQPPVSWDVDTNVNSATLDYPNVTGTEDSDGSGGPSTSAISGTYTVQSNGKAVVSSGGVQQVFVYIISTSQFIAMDASSGSTNPTLTDFHQ
jgi:hypothetical protein